MILSVEAALDASLRICTAGVLLSSLERLAILRTAPELLDWQVLSVRRQSTAFGWSSRVYAIALGTRTRLALTLATRAALALALTLGVGRTVTGPMIAVLFGITLLMQLGLAYGGDGAEQMMAILLVVFAIYYVSPNVEGMAETCAYFIVAQGALAYCTSGFVKLISPVWRNGNAIRGVLCTRAWGSPSVGRWVTRWPMVGFAASWAIMIWEFMFPSALLASPEVLLFALVAGVGFHLCVAIFMGLNNFVYAFGALYPCFIWWNGSVAPRLLS